MGLPHSKTLSRLQKRHYFRQVLECGSPMPLSLMMSPLRPLAYLPDFISWLGYREGIGTAAKWA